MLTQCILNLSKAMGIVILVNVRKVTSNLSRFGFGVDFVSVSLTGRKFFPLSVTSGKSKIHARQNVFLNS
jgi:hypothetical protein